MDRLIQKVKVTTDLSTVRVRICVLFEDGVSFVGRVIMSGTLADQFDAAVRIIHGLPKNGGGWFTLYLLFLL